VKSSTELAEQVDPEDWHNAGMEHSSTSATGTGWERNPIAQPAVGLQLGPFRF
jgi:hypothetical protein